MNNLSRIRFQSFLHWVLGLLLLLISFAYNPQFLIPTQFGQFYFLLIFTVPLLILFAGYLFFYIKDQLQAITSIDILLMVLFLYTLIFSLYKGEGRLPFEYWGEFSLVLIYLTVRLIPINATKYILLGLVGAGLGQALYGNLQLFDLLPSHHNIFKITGGFFNPAPYAGFLISVLPVPIAICIFKNKISNAVSGMVSTLSLITVICIVAVLPSTLSRAAWIGALISIGYLYYFIIKNLPFINRIFKGKKRILAIITLVVFIAIGLFELYNLKQKSADGRLLIWKVSATIIKNQPFGLGFGKFKGAYMDYQSEYFKTHEFSNESRLVTDSVDFAYNEFLHLTVEFGIIGLILALLISYKSLFFSINSTDSKHLILIHTLRAGLVGIFAFSSFSYPIEIWPICVVGIFYLSSLNKFMAPVKFLTLSNIQKKSILIPVSILLVSISPFFTYKIIKGISDYESWKTADVLYSKGRYLKSLNYYNKAYGSLNTNGLFLEHYGKALIMSNKPLEAITILKQSLIYKSDPITYIDLGDCYTALNKFSLAKEMYLRSYQMMPSRAYPMYLLAKLCQKTGDTTRAVQLAEVLVNRKFIVSSPAILQMKKEMYKMIAEINIK